jgi:hypothetical protein
MTRRLLMLLILFAVIFAPSAAARVKADTSPLMFLINGDIYTWKVGDANPIQQTTWGHNHAPVISPSATMIAYKSTAKFVIGQAGGGPGDLPSTIWILDVNTFEGIRIADQPANASMYTAGAPDNYILRSDPTWSPDSTQIAWTEMVAQNGQMSPTPRLVVYTLATKETRVIIANLPPQGSYEGSIPMAVKWGSRGIAVKQLTIKTDQGLESFNTLWVYDPNGSLISQSSPYPGMADFVWIDDQSNAYLGILTYLDKGTPKNFWQFVDPLTGSTSSQIPGGVPELYSVNAPSGTTIRPASVDLSGAWIIENTSTNQSFTIESPLGINYPLLNRVGISSDGGQVAYMDSANVVVTTGNSLSNVPVASPTALIWGPTAWRIHSNG